MPIEINNQITNLLWFSPWAGGGEEINVTDVDCQKAISWLVTGKWYMKK